MKTIGLTGCIGSGKSEVARILANLGATIIDADVLARQAVAPNSPVLLELKKHFPAKFFQENGTLNRALMAQEIFSDPGKKQVLEKLVHPEVRRLFVEQHTKASSAQNSKLIVYVVPLLLQARSSYPELEKVVVVTAGRERCLERIIKRDKCSRELAERKFNSQPAPEAQKAAANWIISNDGDLNQLESQVNLLYPQLIC